MPKQAQFEREEVLESLIPLFIDKGYNGASMQDIVDYSQLNRSSIYNSFGDKYQLYQAVLKKYAERQNNISDKILSKHHNVRTALKMFLLELFIEGDHAPNVNGCLLSKCALEMSEDKGAVKELVESSKKVMLQSFEEVLAEGQTRQQIKSEVHPHSMALFIYNTIQGLRIMNAHTVDVQDTKAIIDSLFQQI